MKQNFEIFEHNLEDSKFNSKINNWPVVYLLNNNNDLYIGETNDFASRLKSHKQKIETNNLKQIKIIFSDQFNKSAVYDIETKLINYLFSDQKFNILNKDLNQQDLQYYNKELYSNIYFKEIWQKLKQLGFAKHELFELEEKTLFKYSPFKALSSDQYKVLSSVINHIFIKNYPALNQNNPFDSPILTLEPKNNKSCVLINGSPGTGKTLLAVKILKTLSDSVDPNLNIAFCLPQSSMRGEITKLLKELKIVNVSVISPEKLTNNFDILIIDEAHRLKQYTGIYARYPNHLVIDKLQNIFTNELKLALDNSKHVILLYDQFQKVRDTDIKNFESFLPANSFKTSLTAQFRVKAGTDYIKFIRSLLQIENTENVISDLGNYEIKFFDSLEELHNAIKIKEKKHTRCRIGSGYYIKHSKETKQLVKSGQYFDFAPEGYNINWNNTIKNWFNSKNAINEIGCIHTLQGYDLNYIGVIFGDEIIYDPITNQIEIRPDNYFDIKSFPKKDDPDFYEKLKSTIKNIYYVLMTRGILGTYLYVKDPNLRKYLESQLVSNK